MLKIRRGARVPLLRNNHLVNDVQRSRVNTVQTLDERLVASAQAGW
jgi:hypothetical protein